MASLLLRLFHSDYFSPHLALSYLRTYSDNIGITYYLVSQLESAFPSHQVEFYWPQLCHLLITKPSESRALECFILRRCSESVHVALLTLWYFQAALSDLSSNPHTASFHICHRVFNQCQRILFEDPLCSTNSVYALGAAAAAHNAAGPSNSHILHSGLQGLLAAATSFSRQKVSPHSPLSNIVGIGSVMASVPGMPKLASITGNIAIEQARQPAGAMQDALASRAGAADEDDDDIAEDDADHYGDSHDRAEEDAVDSSDNDSLNEKSERNTHDAAAATHAPEAQPSQSSLSSLADSLVKMASSVSMSRAETAPLPPPKDNPLPPPKKAPMLSPSASDKEITSGGSLPAADTAKKVENPFATFAAGFNAGFNDFKGKAAAAVGEVFGQAQDSAGNPSTSASSAAAKKKPPTTTSPPPWSPRKHRQLNSFRQQAATSRSVPNLVSTRGSISSAFASSATLDQSAAKTEAILTLYNAEARRSLLRSNYCKVQTQFLLSLQDISARLLLLPKPARLSALRAELTALNHKLPSDVCFPLWCTADDKDVVSSSVQKQSDSKSQPRRHHRVIRINPSEAVVLNSADRVPFLLHVEVLNNDLDFDPDRRQNRETLRRLVTEEDVRRRKVAASSGRSSFVQSAQEHARTDSEHDAETRIGTPDAAAAQEAHVLASDDDPNAPTRTSTPKPISQPLTPTIEQGDDIGQVAPKPIAAKDGDERNLPQAGEEEIDLTEQMYGSDLAGFGGERDPSSSDDEEQDLASRNRMHDAAAWTSATTGSGSALGSVAGKATNGDADQLAAGHRPMKEFSLDEYAQRMRTAAIMLSQLNKSTNASKAQAIVNYGPNLSSNAQGGWSSWIVPTNWYGSSNPAAPANGAGGGVGDKSEVGQGSAGVTTHVRTSIDPTRAMAGMPMGGGGGAGQSSRLVHAETEAIRKRIMEEMMALEEERMRRMKTGGRNVTASRQRARSKQGQMPEDEEEAVLRAVNKDDPSAAMFSESWAAKKQRIRASSPYGHLSNWDVFSVIVKTGADLRQEQLAVQLINEFGRIWQETGSRCWVRYFRILVTSENSGLMETITDAVSVHSIKKEAYSRMSEEDKSAGYTLYDYFLSAYGPSTSASFNRARDRFMESLAGYSIISYLLQIKDRHNGNILVDGDGRLIHIDFGFMLGISPGGVGFEAAPFKMPQEYIDILGGLESAKFEEFKVLMRQGFRDVRKHAERIIMLVELMAKDSKLPCFALGDLTAANLRDRFQLALSQTQCDEFVDRLILSSAGSAFTRLYDMYQRLTEGVL
ncbi:hypothetical protein NDA16_002551 [Ustilago loliicola]|nr:hypothetical protein NDA16_002551 [Ustilago loliicola]